MFWNGRGCVLLGFVVKESRTLRSDEEDQDAQGIKPRALTSIGRGISIEGGEGFSVIWGVCWDKYECARLCWLAAVRLRAGSSTSCRSDGFVTVITIASSWMNSK